MSEQRSKGGRPRKWESEAERKRAYRLRRNEQLADVLALRDEVRTLRATVARADAQVEAARRDVDQWRAKAAAADRRAAEAGQKAGVARQKAQRAVAERDEAKRLLRRKLQWAGQAERLRDDPDALLALVAELYQERAALREEVQQAHRLLQRLSW